MAEIPDWAKTERKKTEEGDRDRPLEEQVTEDAPEITQFAPLESWAPGDLWDYLSTNLRAEAGLAFEPSAKAQEGILREQLPEDYRVEYSPKYDATLVQDPEGATGFVNRPGMSLRDLSNFISLASAFTPAGRLYGMGRTPAQGATLSSLGATATEAIRQKYSDVFGSTANDQNVVPGMNIPEAATAFITQYLPDFMQGSATIGRVAPGAPPDIAMRLAGREQALNTAGLQAMRGQLASDVPAELEDLKALSQFPETSPGIADEFQQQNLQSQERVGRLIEDIERPDADMTLPGATDPFAPPPIAPVEPGDRFKSAIEALRGGLVEGRKRQTEGLYEQAMDSGRDYVTAGLDSQIRRAQQNLAPGSEAHRRLEYVRKLVSGDTTWEEIDGMQLATNVESRNLRQLHDAKQEVDKLIQKAVEDGNQSLVAQLENTQSQLRTFIEARSPAYKQAREAFAALSQPIDQFDQSIFGTVARLDRQNAYRLGDLIFNPKLPNATRNQIRETLNYVDPNAFRMLAGSHMRNLLDQVTDISTQGVENVPYHINKALFKNRQMRDMWKDAFPERADEIDALSKALEMQGTGRSAGSPTATRKLVMRDKGYETSIPTTMAQAAADIMKWLTVLPKAAEGALSTAGQRMESRARREGLSQQLGADAGAIAQDWTREAGEVKPWITALIQAGEGSAD